MAKIYGVCIRRQFTPTGSVRIDRFWYSLIESESLAKIETAKLIEPPENHTVEFTPIEDDVTILEPGIYVTDKKKRVEINIVKDLHAHGRFLRPDGKPIQYETCAFYVNGEPSTHKKWGKIVSKVGA